MAITQALCTSFKKELLEGIHDFRTTGDTFRLALYTSSASLGAATTAYTATNEVSGTGYVAKGETCTKVNPTSSGTTAYTDFSNDVTWASSTITARGAMIFNDTASGDPAVCILDFGADKITSSGDFIVQFPAADASNAIIRLA